MILPISILFRSITRDSGRLWKRDGTLDKEVSKITKTKITATNLEGLMQFIAYFVDIACDFFVCSELSMNICRNKQELCDQKLNIYIILSYT